MNFTPRTQHTNESTRNDPAVQVLVDDQARGLMLALVRSRQWWTLPIVNEAAIDLAAEIEWRHYRGGAGSGDYLLMLGPLPTIFARKSRMPVAALAALMAELCSEWSEAQWRQAVTEQDILVTLPPGADDAETMARLQLWHDWLLGRERAA